jgi:anaerobic ribonucleoside-triphosphate reductase
MDERDNGEVKCINDEIDELWRLHNACVGTQTEVYSRIVGYYRDVGNWNPGKRAEFDERKPFVIA